MDNKSPAADKTFSGY